MAIATGFSQDAVDTIVKHTREHGGGTFGHLWGTPLDLNSGYMVSTDEDRGVVVKLEDFTSTVVHVFVLNNLPYVYRSIYEGTKLVNKRFGTWVADGMVHLDVVELVYDLEDALLLGLEHGQEAIYDNATGDCINVAEGIAKGLC